MMATSVTNLLRLTHDLGGAIRIPAMTRPTLAELRKEFSWIREKDGIETDFSPEGEVTLALATVLADREDEISGLEYERRIAPSREESLVLGFQHWDYLRRNPALLASVPPKVVYIDFFGIVVVLADGDRRFPCLYRFGEDRFSRWDSLDDVFSRFGRLAVSCK